MTSNELLAVLRANECVFIRAGKGSHQLWRCNLRAIQKQLEPCLGKNWWKT